jgi:carotenoid cleavage dioxygenase
MLMNRRDFFIHATSTSAVLMLGHGWPLAWAEETKQNPGWPANPFLQGNCAPVHEEITVDDLTVIGTLPPEIDGMFVRNGPNPQFPPLKHYNWFVADGMLHGVRIQGGKASYCNRYVRTQGWEDEHAAGKALYPGFASDPLYIIATSVLKNRFQNRPANKNPANTALVWHDRRLLALWEGGEPHEIQVPSLDTVGAYTYGGQLKHPFTAHPKVDPVTRELLCFGYTLSKPYVQYSVVNAQGHIAHTTSIDLPRPIMMHDLAVTARYSLFMDLPLTFSLWRMLRGGPVLKFEPELGARVGILPRYATGQEIKGFEVSPCYVFHTLNAYEDGEEVVLLACRAQEYLDPLFMPQEFTPVMYRWRLNLTTGTTREAALDDVPSDFPRINEGLMGRQTRYGYSAGFVKFESSELLKYDYAQGVTERHVHGQGRFGGEGVFVPQPNAQAEDDGWLVPYVYDARDGTSEMVVIDAQDFHKPPVARVRIPARVPYGFHGVWIAGEMLANQG